MKKSLMSNIKNFVDSNVRHRIDRVAHNNNEFFSDDLILVERHFEDIRQVCVDTEKKISTLLQSIQVNGSSHLGTYSQNVQAGLSNLSQNISQQTASLATNNHVTNSNHVQQSTGNCVDQSDPHRSNESLSNNQHINPSNSNLFTVDSSVLDQQFSDDIQQRYKKLPIVGFLRFLVKTSHKLKSDSLLGVSLTHCAQLQAQLTKLYLNHEQTIESQCLKPIQHMLEVDIPNVVKLRKIFIKSHNDLESFRVKYIAASQKQQQQVQQQLQAQHSSSTSYTVNQSTAQQINANKIEQLKKELDEAVMRFEQAKDTYEAEIYGFICRETELVNLIVRYYHLQTDYHQQVGAIIQNSLPTLPSTLACTLRKFAFGTALDEHLRCTGRTIAPVLELCVHLLYSQGLKEEGLFRIPGSSIKIKKLKNAINAWFVNLSDSSELENNQARQTGYSCVVALHNLFKNVVGKLPESARHVNPRSELSVDGEDQQSSQLGYEQYRDGELILDVHSIACLLKLYLRELPEPLFTYTLYDQWIDAIQSSNPASPIDTSDQDISTGQQQRNELRCNALAKVIDKLPSGNHNNLKHLIRFLHVLTSNQQFNKMTSTNLAIAMAPSLIWPKPVELKNDSIIGHDNDTISAQQTLSMSSFGISASLHAMLLDALISNAETLFPQPSDFTLPDFKELTLVANKHRDSKQSSERPLKSTSPAGLSVASSSSFSSNTSNPTIPSASNASLVVKTHSRKGGSMEGLSVGTNDKDSIIALQSSSISPWTESTLDQPSTARIQRGNVLKSSRPASVQIRREDYATSSHQSPSKVPAPPVPPVPIARSHDVKQPGKDSRKLNGSGTLSHRRAHDDQVKSQKPPAPPVPPPTSVRHQLGRLRGAAVLQSSSSTANIEEEGHKPATAPRPVSLRGTGTSGIIADSTHNNMNSIRPTVPPPQRPNTDQKFSKIDINEDTTKLEEIIVATKAESDSGVKTVAKEDIQHQHDVVLASSPSSPQITTEENSAHTGKSISPVISLDSITVASSDVSSASSVSIDGDSSFDDANPEPETRRPSDDSKLERRFHENPAVNRPYIASLIRDTEISFDGDCDDANAQTTSTDKDGLKRDQLATSSFVTNPIGDDSASQPFNHNSPPPARPPRNSSPKFAAQQSSQSPAQQQSTPM